tara:strand:- start:387 stop:569 length:183 start_codon:yes stop_codon:yes gene_type:complete
VITKKNTKKNLLVFFNIMFLNEKLLVEIKILQYKLGGNLKLLYIIIFVFFINNKVEQIIF